MGSEIDPMMGRRPYNKNGNIVTMQKEEKENQPVTLQPAWESNNYPEDELNFKNLTMDEASLALNEPKDKYNLVYFTFLLHGIGVLMPWNMFITATNYFTYKLGQDYTGIETSYGKTFLQYVTFAAQVPNVIFNWLNIFVQFGGDITTRIVWSIGIQVVLFLITIVLAMTDTREWPHVFFNITMISVVIINTATGIYQNTIYGMAAKLPFKYTAAIILGNNICGTFVTCAYLIADLVTDNQRITATYYFIIALFILLICFDSYFSLPLNRFYRHHELKQKKEQQKKRESQPIGRIRVPYFEIFSKALPQLFNVFFVFFCTLAVFPAMHANINALNQEHFIPKEYYNQITCYLTFNFTAMLGSILPKYIIWPKPKYLWIPVVLRVLYIPFFLFCNYQVENKRTLPVFFGDEVYWIVAITMGFTSGYFSSIAMIYTSTTAEPQHAGTAGMFGAACLITGIFAGILISFIWPLIAV